MVALSQKLPKKFIKNKIVGVAAGLGERQERIGQHVLGGHLISAGSSWALCVIFTILVSFSWDNALFASKVNINVV